MAKRTLVRLEDVAAHENLLTAFWLSARGKRHRREVQQFEARLDCELARLRREILGLSIEVGQMQEFRIHDPKPRTIHAPCFRERVLHHALMAQVGPILERSLVDDTFACRRGKGTLAAVLRAQQHSRGSRFFTKLDVRSYFASIDHRVLDRLLRRRVRGNRALELLGRIIDSHEAAPGRGLPIGALTSQHFANVYLGGLDRLVLERYRLSLVRYMDDMVIWGVEESAVREAAEGVVSIAWRDLRLVIKPRWEVMPVRRGVPLCGFRVFADRLLLSRRRKRRYRQARRRWEVAYRLGLVDPVALQAGYASAQAITAHADASAWRAGELQKRLVPDV